MGGVLPCALGVGLRLCEFGFGLVATRAVLRSLCGGDLDEGLEVGGGVADSSA